MVFQHIEKVKEQYTDQYVMVDAERPELARFAGLVGQVRTVNMSGRALIEFIDYHANIGWYDIDLDYLKVVDKPAPKEKKKPAAKKPAAKKAPAKPSGEGKKLSPLEMARMGDSSKKDAPAKKKSSTADILAAARGNKTAEKSKPPAGEKSSVADILAMARGSKKEEPAEVPNEAPNQVVEEVTELEAAEPAKATSDESFDRSSMSVDDMLSWCRGHDA